MTEAEYLYSSYIVNCVFNLFLCCSTIMLNSVTIHAIRKTSTLAKPLKTLLLSLAVSDLGVGLTVQPLYITRLITQLRQNAENNSIYGTISFAFLISANFLSLASFFGVTALTVDRFLAIHLHLRYKELVTHKRVVAAVIFIWVFSASLSLTRLSDLEKKKRFAVFATFQVFCLITTALLYYKIYLAVRHHTNQIHALQLQQEAQNGEMANAARLRKSAVGTFYVYLVFLICYLPQNCIYSATIICGASTTIKVLSRYTLTMVFLNSSLNPLIYCWKMRHIRHAVMDILRKISPSHH